MVLQEFEQHPDWYNKYDPCSKSPFVVENDIARNNFSYNLQNTTYHGEMPNMNHLLALSSILNKPIESYFPSFQGSTHPYSKIVRGRRVKIDEEIQPKIRIMWTSTMLPEKFKDVIINHVVPLISTQNSV